MKFKIRFADQIVGFFIILSLASLVFVIVMLGRYQHWFAKDATFHTVLPSAGGLSKNMAVQYRGFTIGNVKDFYLTANDDVEVIFVIHEAYKDRVKLGSLVEVMISPVGLGNQFLFHAGRGAVHEEGSFIPIVSSAQARELVQQGFAEVPRHDDSVTLIMSRASTTLDRLNVILTQLGEALGEGSDVSEIGQIVGSIQKTLAAAETIPGAVEKTADDVTRMTGEIVRIIEESISDLKPILANINAITTELNDPDGLLYTVLDTDEELYTNLVKSLRSVSEILDNLDRTTAFIPGQLPQLAGLLTDLRVTMKTAEDVLVALTNNPLLRKGIPDKIDSQPGGTSPRDIRF